MFKPTTEISIERFLEQDMPGLVGYNNGILMLNNFSRMNLFSHPTRLKATTVLICLSGVIDCSVNLQNFHISRNHILVNFAGDIIQIHNAHDISGYAIIISEDYLQQLQLDFKLRIQSYICLRNNGPVCVPYEELLALKPYYSLLKKNMEEGNAEVLKGLALALSHTIIALMKRYNTDTATDDKNASRAQQIFDKFMNLLGEYHNRERTLKFYADKMFLSPKYVSGMIKNYSGKNALEWINNFVVLEAKMMLRYTDKNVQEIAYSLNFPTQSAFGKYFKQQVGTSPRQYRMRP